MTNRNRAPQIEPTTKSPNRIGRAVGSFVAAAVLFGAAYGINQEIKREDNLPPQTEISGTQLTPENLFLPLEITEAVAAAGGLLLAASGVEKLVNKRD